MKWIIVLALLLVPTLAIAEDGNNVADQLGDVFSNKGNTYIGAEVIKDFTLATPILGIDQVGLKCWMDVGTGKLDDDVQRDYRGGLRVRIIL